MPCRAEALTVEVTRGRAVESVHLVDAVVVERSGRVVEGWGEVGRGVLPRSAIKPIQAVPLVATGAADRYDLTDVELAMACASHGGQPSHVAAIERWLVTIGLDESALACGAHPPAHGPSATSLAEAGVRPGPRHNNCSGKHLGMLTTCRHLDLPVEGYLRPDHPLHTHHVSPAVADLCAIDLALQAPSVDGCGVPVWTVPLDRLAAGWARLGDSDAGRRLAGAMRAEPFYVAGSDRASTRLMETAGSETVVKGGAEGMFCGAVGGEELGIALKVRDGGGRAAEIAIEWILVRLGVVEDSGPTVLDNWAGTTVGEIRVKSAVVRA